MIHCGPLICGVDEAGVGALAAECVAAAVILDNHRPIDGIKDSKKLSPKKREQLAKEIKHTAIAWSLGIVSTHEIDKLNILYARLLAMFRAIERLTPSPVKALIDGNYIPAQLSIPAEAIIHGDQTVPAIAAASIIAKTERDHMMAQWHLRYPNYGFDRNKGYPTAVHRVALRTHGPSPIHRITYKPVKECIDLIKKAHI